MMRAKHFYDASPSDRAHPVLWEPMAGSAVSGIVDDLRRTPATGPAARALREDRSIPPALNLNPATEAELMTVPGIESGLSATIVMLRGNLGYLWGLADLESVPA
ncbi:MAG: hypothetical protein KA063_07085 [Firmicutes bacterium]|nr:hypothetical protein [Bacillota bacterium]